jgi:endonuclease-3
VKQTAKRASPRASAARGTIGAAKKVALKVKPARKSASGLAENRGRRRVSAAPEAVPISKKPPTPASRRPSPVQRGGVETGAASVHDPLKKTLTRGKRADPGAVLERLSAAIPRPHVELAFENPWQLLIAVILSAQSTDRRVNQVSPEVFHRWPTPAALARAVPAEVEAVIQSTGFFRNKTKAIIGASAMLVERFGGEVPRSIEELIQVPGVARKTANVVLGSAHQIASGVVVDTHVSRVALRLLLTKQSDPPKIEADLCELFPRSRWIGMSHRLVLHGRHVCTARAPACPSCPLNELCPARVAPAEGSWQERAEQEAAAMEERADGFQRVE